MCAGCKLGILPSSFVHQVVKPMKQQASIQGYNQRGRLEECWGTGADVPALQRMTSDPLLTRLLSQKSFRQT